MLGSSKFGLPSKGPKSERVRIIESPTAREVSQVLNLDPVWAAYAIADLQPKYANLNQWLITQTRSGPGLLQLYNGLSPSVLFAMGDEQAVGEAMVRLFRPESVYVTIREEHLESVSRFYDLSDDQLFMWRMVLASPSSAKSNVKLPSGWRTVELAATDAQRVENLYSHGGVFTPDAFQPQQMESGYFYGVESSNGVLLSVAGTHVVDKRTGIAAIGNMYTHPARRSIGLAAVVLERLVARLISEGLPKIVLNVDQKNEAAMRLYENRGFEFYCPYMEGVGVRK